MFTFMIPAVCVYDNDDKRMALGGSQSNSDILNTVGNDNRGTAHAYKYTVGQPFVYPRNDLDYASNFLRMCFAVPAEDYEVNPILSRAMDRIFTLHADHEQNASTSTVRLASSSGSRRTNAWFRIEIKFFTSG